MTLSPEFVQAVREGRIEGLTYSIDECIDPLDEHGDAHWIRTPSAPMIIQNGQTPCDLTESESDHLCAHLRRWMESKVWTVTLGPGKSLTVTELIKSRVRPRQDGFIMMTPSSETFAQESELDRHVAAALWVLGREG
jgi:hypothetical protein